MCGFDNRPLHEAEGANDFPRVPKIQGLGGVLDSVPFPSASFVPIVVVFPVKLAVVVVSLLVGVSSTELPSVPRGPRGGSSVPTMLKDSTPSACHREQ